MTEVPEDRPTVDAIAMPSRTPCRFWTSWKMCASIYCASLVAVAITIGFSLYFTNNLIALLAAPIGGLQSLYATEATDSIGAFMLVGLVAGLALATPYIVFEIWWFIAPGLMPRARQWGLAAIPLALFFFLSGIAFAYFVMLPVALPFLRGFLDVKPIWTVMEYISFVSSLLFWVGVAFEFPLVIFALSAMGFVQPGVLLKQWRIAVVVISIIAAVITPTVDPVNMSLVMGPMIALYFLSILFSYIARAASSSPQKPT
jgi:sec-independent protein translocase protein TatC